VVYVLYPVSMTNDDAEAAFGQWLAQFKQELPNGNALSVFLTAGHLRSAFLAGFVAASCECPDCRGKLAPRGAGES
jgi:hypothetical protein